MLTVSEIKDILRREHLSISKRRGQNFLVEPRIQKRIIAAVEINPDEAILEIGPGLGALTEDLAQKAGQVLAVEKDRALVRLLQENLSGYKNLQIIHQDILEFAIGKFTKVKVKVVGNLPYYITTPIIGSLLEKQPHKIEDIYITVQNEVARRLVAKVGTKDYSALTILVQYFTKPELLFSLPKRAFYPQPKVDSAFVHLRILESASVKVNSQEQFFKIVRTCFNQRRKTILNSLWHQLRYIEKDKLHEALQMAGVDAQARPEVLSLDEFAQIENLFFKRRIKLE